MYKVRATMHGKRITTHKCWRKRSNAERYARDTNYFYKGARAKVVKTKKR